MEGFQVVTMDDASEYGDILLHLRINCDVVTFEHMKMKIMQFCAISDI